MSTIAAKVTTTQIVDPRIEPQPDPVYARVIGPTQNQYYIIPSSGLSDSSITFNNLTTLGVDRAYLDTFELEISATITFNLGSKNPTGRDNLKSLIPEPGDWTFQSWPFNTCCDEARVNINGGAFFSQPLSYIRAKERYMDQGTLSKCYENICPCHKPWCQYESGRNYDVPLTEDEGQEYMDMGATKYAAPTRYGYAINHYMQSDHAMEGGFNNSIVRLGPRKMVGGQMVGYENYYRQGNQTIVKVKWREPVFCSPFSSRYDATYGRPLYNITSMDLAFNMMDLGNMIRVINSRNLAKDGTADTADNVYVESYNVHLESVALCYQVMTIPASIKKPLTTLVPYRRFVPYITQINAQNGNTIGGYSIPVEGQLESDLSITSGVYTLNEMPTAIWVFCAPVKQRYIENAMDRVASVVNPDAVPTQYDWSSADYNFDNVCEWGNWDSNKLFAYMRHVNISLANTTQILNTAQQADLYRIAKANGCEDTFASWGVWDGCLPKNVTMVRGGHATASPMAMYHGAGSVLRLIPGVDIILPDTPLIPAANANNMVLQVSADFRIPPHSAQQSNYALWLLLEYVGVAAISPGQCEISMNPLGGGESTAVAPVMSATSPATEGTLEGSGFWDKLKTAARIASQIAESGAISRILRRVPGAEKAADWAASHGFGEAPRKRGRAEMSGGAVMGKGLSEWV